MVRCPGFGCANLVSNDPNNASHVALGMVCCSEACHTSVYDLTNYVDDVPRIVVDEALVIDLTTADYRIII